MGRSGDCLNLRRGGISHCYCLSVNFFRIVDIAHFSLKLRSRFLSVLPWHNIKNGLPQVRTRLWNDIASWRFWNCWATANPPGAFYLRSSSSHGVCLVVRLIHKISNSKSSTHTCRSIVLWALFELIQLTTSIANCHYYAGIKIPIVDFFVTWTNDFVIIMWPVRNFLLYFAKRAITPV